LDSISEKNTIVRYDWLDNIKAFAMGFVIFAHLGLNGFSPFVIMTSFIKLPLFFAASGFVFNPNKNIKFIDYFKTRIQRIIVPYLCLSILLALFDLTNSNVVFLDWLKSSASSIATGTTMWFLPTLFICNIAMYLTFKVCKNNDVLIIVTSIISFVIGYFFITGKHIFMGINTVFIAYPMCVFGYYLKSFILNMNKNILLFIGIVATILYIGLPLLYRFCNGEINSINMYESRYSSYFYDMIVSYAGVLAFFIAFQYIKFPKFVTWFGKNTLFYYAFHIPACNLTLYILSTFISPIFTKGTLTSSLKYTAIYTIITIILLILLAPICMAVNKYLPFIVGLKKKKATNKTN